MVAFNPQPHSSETGAVAPKCFSMCLDRSVDDDVLWLNEHDASTDGLQPSDANDNCNETSFTRKRGQSEMQFDKDGQESV